MGNTGEPRSERHLRKPAVDLGAKRSAIPAQRSFYNRMGCLGFLFSTVVVGIVGIWLAGGVQWKIGIPIVVAGLVVWKKRAAFGEFIIILGIALILRGGLEALIGEGAWAGAAFVASMLIVGVLWAWSIAGPTPVYSKLAQEADHRCSIAFFRPFRDDHAKDAKNLVVPLLDGYGRVLHVRDETYDSAKLDKLHGAEYSTPIGRFRLKGQTRTFDDRVWQDGVKRILQQVDMAVVDISTLSDNVLWELAQCYQRLPAQRVVCVARTEDPTKDVKRFVDLSMKLKPFGMDPHIRPFCLLYSDSVEGRWWFTNAIHQVMMKIAEEAHAPDGGKPDFDTRQGDAHE